MEKNPPDKDNSFSSRNSTAPTTTQRSSSFNNVNFDHNLSLKDIGVSNSKDVDQFIDDLRAIHDKASGLPEVPDFIEFFSRDMETRVQIYVSGDVSRRFGKSDEEDSDFMGSVRRMSKLIDALCEFQDVDSLLNQTTIVLHRAALLLEEEFRTLLDNSRNNNPDPPDNLPSFYKFSSFNLKNNNQNYPPPDRCILPREADADEYPAYPPEEVARMREIAGTMIAAGYEVECSQAYYLSRRNAIRSHLTKLGYDVVLSMDDVARMTWQSLEAEISRWINAVKACTDVIFPGEKKLGESVFSDSPPVHRRLLCNLIRVMVTQLLDFAEATALAKRSAEKLFKYLDMHETLKISLIPAIREESCFDDLIADISTAADSIDESVVSISADLEESIKRDAARTPIPGGAVHPLTRYVMNYLKYACEYKESLEEIFRKQTNLSVPIPNHHLPSQELDRDIDGPHNFDTAINTTPFSIQNVIDHLDANLDKKSGLYKDPSLQHIFLMNNGRYILQKVKSSPEMRQVMGDTWCRRKSTVLRHHHKNYQRETWNRVLQCLNHDGMIVNGKVNKALLKERCKIFTTTFEEIHRTQSGWMVSDEQLQSELRISISGVLVPAYRSFVGRFWHHFDSGKQAAKYVKYQPEDIEAMIEGLFEGSNNGSLSKRKF